METYLQRLLDTAAPSRADPVGLAPVVRSSSPVFEQDQMPGLTDHRALSADAGRAEPVDASAARATPHRAQAPQQEPLTALPRQAAAPFVPAPPTAEPEAGSPPAIAPRSAPPSGETPVLVVEPPRSRPEAPIERDAVGQPLRAIEVLSPLAARAEHLDTPAAPVELPGAPEPSPLRRFPRNDATPDAPTLPDAIRPDPEPSRAQADRQPVELSPRPKPDLPPAANDAAPPPPALPQAPTITIGHLTVEIVDDRPAAPPSTRPLTAAAASVIGPLGQARTARQLIALRHA